VAADAPLAKARLKHNAPSVFMLILLLLALCRFPIDSTQTLWCRL